MVLSILTITDLTENIIAMIETVIRNAIFFFLEVLQLVVMA
jgi:hypothetical protein